MQFSAVAFVLAKAIFGKTRAKVTHHPVARNLGDHAGGGDAQTVAIAVDDGRLRKWEWKNGKTVDQDVVWRHRKRRESDAHRLMRCAQNIDPVDFDVIDNANGPGDLGVRS